jgi:hypothetical protein
MTAKDLARAVNEAGRLPPRVIVVDERIGSLGFYLAPAHRAEANPDRILTSSRTGTLERLRVESGDSIVAVRDDELARFQRLFALTPQPDSRTGTFSIFRVDRLRAALEPSR